jgi:hypothetical protein
MACDPGGSMTCTLQPGPGPDTCIDNLDCITYYYTCINYACTQIVGDPSLSTCSPPGTLPACPLPPGTCTLSTAPTRLIIPPPRNTTLTWDCQNVQSGSCSLDQGIGAVSETGSLTASPSYSTTYTVTCTGLDGNPASDSADVKVYNFTGGVLREIRR